MGVDVAPSPIYAGGLVFIVEPNNKLVAIKPPGAAAAGQASIAWTGEDGIPDICSPVSNGELVFLLQTYGTLTCYAVADGTMLWEEDLDTSFTASPSLVGDRLYLQSEEGVMHIIEAGRSYREVARCALGEKVYASCAFADGRVYIRGVDNLYCIGSGN